MRCRDVSQSLLELAAATRQDSKFGVTSKLTCVARDNLGLSLFYMHTHTDTRAYVAITTTQDFENVGLCFPGCKAPEFVAI